MKSLIILDFESVNLELQQKIVDYIEINREHIAEITLLTTTTHEMDILSRELLTGYGRYSNFYEKRTKSLNIIKTCKDIRVIQSNTLGYFFGRVTFLYNNERKNMIYELCGDKFETSLYCILLELLSNNYDSYILKSLCNIADKEKAETFMQQVLPNRLI